MRFVRVALLTVILATPLRAVDFKRSDCNADNSVNIADAVFLLTYLFHGGQPSCLDTCDSNDDGNVDIADAVFHLAFLKPPHPPVLPSAPFVTCGPDPTPDALDCANYPPCP
ncbi:MAG: dockerin type I domain-containing protein [Planctomycetota bacterium]